MDEAVNTMNSRGWNAGALSCLIWAILLNSGVAQIVDGPRVRSQMLNLEGAQMRLIQPGTGFFPDQQPEVYWHDGVWSIDLVVDPQAEGPPSVRISGPHGLRTTVRLPLDFIQVDVIRRGPANKAVILGEASGAGAMTVAIVDLEGGTLIDHFGLLHGSLSPDGRFIVYINGYGTHSAFTTDDQYRVYDLLRTPRENTCGYRANDPDHRFLDDNWRGQPMFSVRRDEEFRPNEDPALDPVQAHHMAGDFVWASDSSKVAFADKRGSELSVVVSAMPISASDVPRTLVHSVVDEINICSSSKCAGGWPVILEWHGENLRALLRRTRLESAITLNLAMPQDFSPAER